MRNRIAGFAGGAFLCLLFSSTASAEYLGDYAVGTDNICTVANGYQPSTGASFAIASVAVDVYKDDSDVQDNDSGLTISAFDSLTGAYMVCVDTSSDGTFYSAGSIFHVLVSVGTVDSVSVVGSELMTFSLAKGAAFARLGAPAGASVSEDVAAMKVDTAAILVDTGTTLDDFLDTEIADIRRAIGPATTTIATLASQTSFTLTAGSADDNAYNGWGLIVVDASSAVQTALGCVLDYTGSTKTVTLRSDPAIFTMATTDNVILLPSFCTTGVDVTTIETVDATDQLDAHAAAGLDAAGVRTAVGLATANLDTQLGAIDDFVDTEVAAILVDTGTTLDDFLDTEVAAILSDTNAILVDTGTTLEDFLDTEITALMNARTQLFPGGVDADSVLTADSGDTNTLVDTELTFAAAQDIDGVYVVRSDGQRCLVDSFVPATDTIEFGACTFTGAWSTQTYKLYPAGTQ